MALQFSSTTQVGIGSGGAALNSLANTSAAQTDTNSVSTVNNVVDVHVQVSIALGAITPSTSTLVEIYAFASPDGTTWPGASATNEVLGTGAGAVTLSANGNNLRFLGTILAHTASVTVKSEPLSLASAFGSLPRKWGIVIKNSTGVAFAASGHSVSYTEVYYN